MASPRSNRKYCIASNCSQTSYRSDTHNSFFTLPKEEQRRIEWLTTLGREDLLDRKDLNIKGYLVCSAHFDEDSIKIMRQLKSDAVPNKCLPEKEARPKPRARTADAATQSRRKVKLWAGALSEPQPEQAEPHGSGDSTRRKRKLAEQEPEEDTDKSKRRKTDDTKLKTNKHGDEISRRFQSLMKWHKEVLKRFNSDVNDAEYKIFVLNFYISCPKAYKVLQSLLKLPTKSNLDKMKVYTPPELDGRILNLLSLKLESLPEMAKYCSICIEETSLQHGARAYAVLLQGLVVQWTQPVVHGFMDAGAPKAELDAWLNEVISKLYGIGIEVKALISNHGSIFDLFAKTTKKITIDEPYFYVDNHKIFYIFDVPYLLKCIRNGLMTSDFYFDGDVISFEHIASLVKDQKERSLKLTPKVSEMDVEQRRGRSGTRLAARLFSHAVHAALDAYIGFGRMPRKAKATSHFVKAMNDLFDVLNSSKLRSEVKLRNALVMNEEQRNVLEYSENMFARIQSVNRLTGKNNTKSLKSLHNFQITIQAVQQLFEDMKKEGFESLVTRRVNAECALALRRAVRAQAAERAPLSRTQYTLAFSKLFSRIILREAPEVNREEDIQEILREAEYFMNSKNTFLP